MRNMILWGVLYVFHSCVWKGCPRSEIITSLSMKIYLASARELKRFRSRIFSANSSSPWSQRFDDDDDDDDASPEHRSPGLRRFHATCRTCP
jgi:hypothetical protein